LRSILQPAAWLSLERHAPFFDARVRVLSGQSPVESARSRFHRLGRRSLRYRDDTAEALGRNASCKPMGFNNGHAASGRSAAAGGMGCSS
jgi:hypothetical protein